MEWVAIGFIMGYIMSAVFIGIGYFIGFAVADKNKIENIS